MNKKKTYYREFALLIALCLLFFCLNIGLGSVSIPLSQVLSILAGIEAEKASWATIVWDFRFPRAMTALLAGAGLSLSGLMMQTLFRNPIAGPYVLGISSGASLGVALLVLGTGVLGVEHYFDPLNHWNMAIFSILGASFVLMLVLAVSFRVRDVATLLIVGLMFGSLVGALVTVLQYYSGQEELKRFVLWGFGSLSGVTHEELWLLFPIILFGILWTFGLGKTLNLLLLGEGYAHSLGLSLLSSRISIIGATALMTGTITAFCGPLAFLGIAVPHLARMLTKTQQHRVLIPATLLMGSILLLGCDILAQLPFFEQNLPINAVTSLVGAPVVIQLILRRKTL